ncbi:MAG: cupin domain-containing protein [Halobacteriota archaeon]
MAYQGTDKGRALNIRDLIDYATDSVVSKTLIDTTAGTITLFAFDTAQGLSEHTAPFDAVVQIIDGEAAITISGNTTKVTEGQMIIMPAHIPHALKAVTRFKMLLTMIRA